MKTIAIGLLSILVLSVQAQNQGVLDETFFGTGYKVFDALGDENDDIFNDIAIDKLGHMTIAGQHNLVINEDAFAAKLRSDGSFMENWINGGYVSFEINNIQNAFKEVFSLPDNSVILVGETTFFGDRDVFLAKLLPSGAYDESFGENGTTVFNANDDGYDHFVRKFIALKDGGFLLLVQGSKTGIVPAYSAAVRYDSDGQLVDDFGINGAIPYFAGVYPRFMDAVELDNGDLIIGSLNRIDEVNQMVLIGLDKNGFPRDNFGNGGFIGHPVNTTNGNFSFRMMLTPNQDRLITAGTWQLNNANAQIYLARFRTNGSIDLNFGDGGFIYEDRLPAAAIGLRQVKMMPDGHFWALLKYFPGGTPGDVGVIRYDSDGNIDTRFNEVGYWFYSMTDGQEYVNNFEIDQEGRMVIVGSIESPPNNFFGFLTRINLDLKETTSLSNTVVRPLRVFPNPASDRVYLENWTGQKSKYSIINMNGQTVKSAKLDGNSISVSGLTAGLYQLVVRDQNTRWTGRVVIR